jgi:hypothetical protein
MNPAKTQTPERCNEARLPRANAKGLKKQCIICGKHRFPMFVCEVCIAAGRAILVKENAALLEVRNKIIKRAEIAEACATRRGNEAHALLARAEKAEAKLAEIEARWIEACENEDTSILDECMDKVFGSADSFPRANAAALSQVPSKRRKG